MDEIELDGIGRGTHCIILSALKKKHNIVPIDSFLLTLVPIERMIHRLIVALKQTLTLLDGFGPSLVVYSVLLSFGSPSQLGPFTPVLCLYCVLSQLMWGFQ